MSKLKDMSIEDLEQLIENKFIELIGDPDSGLQLKKAFKEKLEKRFKKPAKRLSHQEVLKKLA